VAAGEHLLVADVAFFVGPRLVARQSLPPVVAVLRREPVEEFDPFGDPAQPNRLLFCECGEQSTLLALGRQVEVAVTREGAGDVTGTLTRSSTTSQGALRRGAETVAWNNESG
jgi:hypothetical protein